MGYVDIDLILTQTPYFMLLSYNSDMINMIINYIKYYIQILLYRNLLATSTNQRDKFLKILLLFYLTYSTL